VGSQARTCQQLREVLQSGAQALMQRLFDDYLLLCLDARKTAGKGKGSGQPGAARGGPGNGGRGQGRYGRGRGGDRWAEAASV